MARPLLADPEWPQKAAEGRVEDIRKCLSCGECLYVRGGAFNYPQSCAVNAVFGKEGTWTKIEPAAIKKKVMVIGGGPAGLEAARVASLRGHEVTVYDKNNELGGQLLLAAKPPGKQRILWIRDYLATQLEKQGVEINMGVEVTQERIAENNPDEIILAAGAVPKGIDLMGTNTNRVIHAWEILSGDTKIENQKVVILGGSMMACETAEALAVHGNDVSVVKMRPGSYMAEDCEPTNRRGIMDFLTEHKVKQITDHKFEKVTGTGVDLTDKLSGEPVSIDAQAIVIALGSKPERSLADSLEADGIAFRMIGDCCKPNNIKQAVYDGSLVGRQI